MNQFSCQRQKHHLVCHFVRANTLGDQFEILNVLPDARAPLVGEHQSGKRLLRCLPCRAIRSKS